MEGGAHAQIGDRLARLGRGAEAEPELQAALALALARAQNQTKREGDALAGLSLLANVRGDTASAAALNELAFAIRRLAGHGYHLATALLNAAMLAQNLGDNARAWQRLAEATALLPRVGSQDLSQHAAELAVAQLGRARGCRAGGGIVGASPRQRVALEGRGFRRSPVPAAPGARRDRRRGF